MRATTVGFSGSGASRRALRWGVQSCAATGRPLHVLVGPGGAPGDLDGQLAEELLRVPGREPAVDVTLTPDDPVHALLSAAAEGSDLVLGAGRDVAPQHPGAGGVLGAVLAAAPGPVVLVGPRAVLTPTRRLLVVASPRGAAADWVLRRGRDLPVHLLTAWRAPSGRDADGGSGRRHAHLAAVAVHHGVRARLSAGTHRPVRAEVAEGALADVLPRRVGVGDLVVLTAGSVGDLPLRTLRAPVVLVPVPVGTDRSVVDLRERVRTPAG
ncbi:hypothetical protein AB2L28_04625 [Kineococcus sp. TBRC 1896]|uniref:Universal stress protein family protein n=1 Tax=Kineococcus mangrovi TaxID=1660183 RepID=A0ABV4I2L2_9ACTN